jgi:zinc protease
MARSRTSAAWIAIAAFLAAPLAPAQAGPPNAPAAKAEAPPGQLRLEVRRDTLDNGLRVLVHVDRTTPTVAVSVVYDVGSRNEERGRSGFAHLFEHMMFQGSANVARGEHFRLVTARGGVVDATTSADHTAFYQLLPSHELALALWLEADRMRSLEISQRNLDNQRAVVKEEYRMRVLNAAYGPARIRLQELVYQGFWPYEHAGIGTMRDLDAADLSWVRAFHRAYYAPNNAVLSISGDVDPAQALALARRYFGSARRAQVPTFEPGALPPQGAPRSAIVEDGHAKLPALFAGWAIAPSHEPDHYPLVLAAMLLGDGQSSRLYRALVRERGLAVDTSASTEGFRGPDMLSVVVKLASNASVPAALKLVESQIDDIARLGPSDAEMKKLKNRIRSRFLMGLQSNVARAQKLAECELYRGDARLLDRELDAYLAVTKADIKRVVSKYLAPSRRSLVEVKPGSTPPRRGPS